MVLGLTNEAGKLRTNLVGGVRERRHVAPSENGRGRRANANSRPSDITGDYWVTGIKIGGTPKTGSGRYTRRCTTRRGGGQTGTGVRGRMSTAQGRRGRLPELWSRRSTAFGRVLKCVISDRDLSPCPDYATSSALRPRRYAIAESRRSRCRM